MFLFAAAAQAYPLQPEPVEGAPSYTTQPTNAVLQPLQHRVRWLRGVRRRALDRLGLQRVRLRGGREEEHARGRAPA